MKFREMFGNAGFVCGDEGCISPFFRGRFNGKAGDKTEITVCGLGFFRLYVKHDILSLYLVFIVLDFFSLLV